MFKKWEYNYTPNAFEITKHYVAKYMKVFQIKYLKYYENNDAINVIFKICILSINQINKNWFMKKIVIKPFFAQNNVCIPNFYIIFFYILIFEYNFHC